MFPVLIDRKARLLAALYRKNLQDVVTTCVWVFGGQQN